MNLFICSGPAVLYFTRCVACTRSVLHTPFRTHPLCFAHPVSHMPTLFHTICFQSRGSSASIQGQRVSKELCFKGEISPPFLSGFQDFTQWNHWDRETAMCYVGSCIQRQHCCSCSCKAGSTWTCEFYGTCDQALFESYVCVSWSVFHSMVCVS